MIPFKKLASGLLAILMVFTLIEFYRFSFSAIETYTPRQKLVFQVNPSLLKQENVLQEVFNRIYDAHSNKTVKAHIYGIPIEYILNTYNENSPLLWIKINKKQCQNQQHESHFTTRQNKERQKQKTALQFFFRTLFIEQHQAFKPMIAYSLVKYIPIDEICNTILFPPPTPPPVIIHKHVPHFL